MVKKNAVKYAGMIGAVIGGSLFMSLPTIIGKLVQFFTG